MKIESIPPVIFYYEDEALKPFKKHETDAGFDLKSAELKVIPPHSHAVIHTGVRVVLKKGLVGFIKPRSGLSAKYGIDVLAGVVDSDYRGEILVVLMNNSQHAFEVTKEMRIAQFVPIFVASLEAGFEQGNPPKNTKRGEKGFGSTGK